MFGNWRPDFNPDVIHRELGIIKDDLRCNAVRVCGLDINRLMTAAEDALGQGLNVWLSPEMWDKDQDKTLAYVTKAAEAAEQLNTKYPGRTVFLVGSELTLFMQGIVPGKNVSQRMGNPANREMIRAGKHNEALNPWLAKANNAVRDVFHGPVSYASLVWEKVDWDLFDYVGVDHCRSVKINDRYIDMLQPPFSHGKPVVITEFGSRTYKGADTTTEGMAGTIVDNSPTPRVLATFILNAARSSLFGTQLPPPRPRLKKGGYERDEAMQARALTKTLELLEEAGVEGTFVMTFVSPTSPYDDNPKFDLDLDSFSLVKSYQGGRHGSTYPDMTWEPKEAFKAVSEYYANH